MRSMDGKAKLWHQRQLEGNAFKYIKRLTNIALGDTVDSVN